MINSRWLTSFLFILDIAVSDRLGSCRSKSFNVSTDRANYFQAIINCKSMGMELASIENEDQSEALEQYLNTYKKEGYDNGFWLSGTNLNKINSRQYYWLSNGQPAIYTNWLSGQPSDYQGKQHNIRWVMLEGKTGWDDDTYERVSRYICEY